MGGVSKFCRVIKANFAELLQPLINISFPEIVGEGAGGGGDGGGGGGVLRRHNIKQISGQYISLYFSYHS